MQERIFDMFHQLPQEGALASGLGIGLTVVRELSSRHDGSLTVESSGEDRGSTFTVRLPIPTTPASHEHATRTRKRRSARRAAASWWSTTTALTGFGRPADVIR